MSSQGAFRRWEVGSLLALFSVFIRLFPTKVNNLKKIPCCQILLSEVHKCALDRIRNSRSIAFEDVCIHRYYQFFCLYVILEVRKLFNIFYLKANHARNHYHYPERWKVPKLERIRSDSLLRFFK